MAFQFELSAEVMAASYTPGVVMMGMSLKSSNRESAEVDVHFQIKNPHPTTIDLVDVDFLFEEEDAGKQMLVKKVQHPYVIQGCTSKLMTVPVNLEYSEIVTTTSGRFVPCTMRAELSFRETVSGIFKVSVDRVKHFLNVVEQQQNESAALRPVSAYVNGVHIASLSPTHVGFSIILRVSNGNSIPVQLDKAKFVLESGEQELVEKEVIASQTIPSKGQKRVEMALNIEFNELKPGYLPKAGEGFPFKLKMDFLFKDSAHGAYKISQEKLGAFPLLSPAKAHVEEVVFERGSYDEPVAKIKLQLKGLPLIKFKLTKVDYVIHHAHKDKGDKVADASYSGIVELEGSNNMVLLDLVMEPVEDAAFGSALWDAFSDKDSTYKATVSVKGESLEYGDITV